MARQPIIFTENTIRKAIREALGYGFSFGYLKSIRSIAGKVKYCQRCLGKPIGRGSSRLVFQLDDHWVLKLAMNRKGLAQNEQEGQPDSYRDGYGLFPEVNYKLSDMDDYTFIVSEYVLPANEQDFVEALGITCDKFYQFLRKNAYERYLRGDSTDYSGMTDEEYRQLLDNETLEQWSNYAADYNMSLIDLNNTNFGLTMRDGAPAIVMLDSGITDDLYKQYYTRQR